MIKFENTVTPSAEQWKAIIFGARNPLNSWDRYDSFLCTEGTMTNEEIDETCGKCPKTNCCDIYDFEKLIGKDEDLTCYGAEYYTEIVGSRIKALYPDIPVYIKMPCSLCGKDHEEMVVDGHISQVHMCEDCFRKLAEEWQKERKEERNE